MRASDGAMLLSTDRPIPSAPVCAQRAMLRRAMLFAICRVCPPRDIFCQPFYMTSTAISPIRSARGARRRRRRRWRAASKPERCHFAPARCPPCAAIFCHTADFCRSRCRCAARKGARCAHRGMRRKSARWRQAAAAAFPTSLMLRCSPW